MHCLQTKVVDITVDADRPFAYPVELDRVCREAAEAVNEGHQFIVLSDRQAGPDRQGERVTRIARESQ